MRWLATQRLAIARELLENGTLTLGVQEFPVSTAGYARLLGWQPAVTVFRLFRRHFRVRGGRPWWRTCGILWGTPKVFGRLT
jgi:hypothetical protein